MLHLALAVSSLLSLCAGDPYVPGNPGASWTQDEILIMKAKFFQMFSRMDNAPKFLRLGFHDCIKYADGTGGCDGCLNWKGMDIKLAIGANARNLSVEDGGGNNGLGDTVRNLERFYTETTFLGGASLTTSPMELGWSRADLWAFSSMMAVEFGVLANNLICDDIDMQSVFGSPYFDISQFPYQWTSKGGRQFNNDYYRNIVGEDKYFINVVPHTNCELIGNAFGEKPKTQWLAHTRSTSENGGPVFWIHRNHVCPACNFEKELEGDVLGLKDWEKDCCHNKPEGTSCSPDRASPDEDDDNLNGGCEQMKFIIGADEIAINAEMGLYKKFEVDDDGVIFGCPGLEIFNDTRFGMRGTHWKEKGATLWSITPGSWAPEEPECEKQTIEHPAGSGEPLYTIFEEFASKQTSFVRDFVTALEKMLTNGYPGGLTDAPDHWTDVSCPLP